MPEEDRTWLESEKRDGAEVARWPKGVPEEAVTWLEKQDGVEVGCRRQDR